MFLSTTRTNDFADVMTVGTAAREIGVSAERVRQYIRDGRLSSIRGPLNYRMIPKIEVQRLVRERERKRG